MIHDLNPYPAYKDSGVPWLGEVPEHWEIRRLKHIYQRIVGGSTPSSSEPSYWGGDVIWITPVDVSRSKRLTTSLRKITREGLASCSSELVPPECIVVTSRAPVGNVAIAMVDLCTNQGCKALVPDETVVQSAYGFATFHILQAELQSLATGTTFTEISTSKLGAVPLPLPPLLEQSAIVRYLDHIDRRIRRYIRAKQKLIKLLEEQKQVIIHRAVTRGLDPNVRLKPSGVEWLGEIPEHWEVRRVKGLFCLRIEKSGKNHGKELLSIYTHIGVRPRKDMKEKGNKASTTDDYWVVKKGDLISNKLLAWMGAIGVSHFDGVTSPAYDILMPAVYLYSDYYHHLFRTKLYLQQFKQRSRGIMDMRLRLYFDQFGQILVPVPPVDEQRAIVNFYNDATEDTDRIIDRARREISLLQEYRTRLIADVVTGKLDVREAAAKLPEETDEPEDFDDALAGDEEAGEDELESLPEEET